MKATFLLLLLFPLLPKAQDADCILQPPLITIHFGTGNVRDPNTASASGYRRITSDCPTDGYYAYAPATPDCFGGDWLTLTDDHTPGDAAGNMMLVNAAWNGGTFFTVPLSGFKSNTRYEFGAWLMNLCKPSDKCPFPLLPNLTIRLQTPDGKTVAQFNTGELARRNEAKWEKYTGLFTTPAGPNLILTMADDAPGGCGNDFALDDISFRECVKPPPVVVNVTKAPVTVKRQPAVTKTAVKKPMATPVKRETKTVQIPKRQTAPPAPALALIKQRSAGLPAPPALATRENPLVRRIETEAGEIKLDLYDNGEIDGDTVSIYHNNVLIEAKAALSAKPITLRIAVDAAHPHHEFIMVAENLGSIPPNTSLMIITTAARRYEVFISSTQQKNAKLVIDLKE